MTKKDQRGEGQASQALTVGDEGKRKRKLSLPTRRERKARQAKAEEEVKFAPRLWRQRVRLIPIWLRIVIVGLLAGVCLLTGLVVGYGVIGNGENAWEVLDPQLWYDMMDAIRGG